MGTLEYAGSTGHFALTAEAAGPGLPRPPAAAPVSAMAALAVAGPALDMDQLRTRGFVVIENKITPRGLVRLNAAVDGLLAADANAADFTCPWLFEGDVGEALWALATEPAIVDLMKQTCGPSVALWAGGLACKAPHGAGLGEVPYHQCAPCRSHVLCCHRYM